MITGYVLGKNTKKQFHTQAILYLVVAGGRPFEASCIFSNHNWVKSVPYFNLHITPIAE